MVREGDIVEIPLPDGRNAVGWIIHKSRHFKDAIGFVVFGIAGDANPDVVYDPETGQPVTAKVLGPMYTHVDAIEHYRWKITGNQEISESKRKLSMREVGGGVYIGDDYIGSVEEVGDPNIRPMLTMGMPVVYRRIEEAFGSSP